jgi:hypothetical protein
VPADEAHPATPGLFAAGLQQARRQAPADQQVGDGQNVSGAAQFFDHGAFIELFQIGRVFEVLDGEDQGFSPYRKITSEPCVRQPGDSTNRKPILLKLPLRNFFKKPKILERW